MAQKSVTTPVRSPNQTPFQARLPTALRGQGQPSILTLSGFVIRTINGIKSGDTAPSIIHVDFLPAGGGDLVTDGITRLKGFPTNLDLVTRCWTMFKECNETYTDSATPANDYTATSSISGAGQCPQASGYPTGQPFFPYPPQVFGYNPDFPPGWNVGGGDWLIPSSDISPTATLTRSITSPIDPADYYSTAKSDMLAMAPGFSGHYDDGPASDPNTDCSVLTPGDFTGDLITSGTGTPGAGSAIIIRAAAACGWQLSVGNSASSESLIVYKERALLTGGAFYFWIGLWETGLPNNAFQSGSTGVVINRITLLSEGWVTSGQTIGLAEDGATHPLSFPDDAFPINAMGTNAITRRLAFAVIGVKPNAWLAGFGLHLGDNF